MDFSPDGTLLATIGDDGTTQIWRASDGVRLRTLPSGPGYFVRFSANAQWLYTMIGGDIKFWRVSDGALLNTFTGLGASSLAVAANGKYFAYGTVGGVLVLAYTTVVITSITHQRFHATLQWEGGSGRYQVQRRRRGSDGHWHRVGRPTTATAACVSGRTNHFNFRVISLTPK